VPDLTVACASVPGLLRFVTSHSIVAFTPYRVTLGVAALVGVALT
jgi:undecaprenyl pyrophosphate phosphatase UppP